MEFWYNHSMKKTFSAEFKVKVAIEAIRGIKSMSEIAGAYGVHPTQIGFWKRQLVERAPALFADKRAKNEKTPERVIDELYKIIGQRDVEIEWMKKNLRLMDT